MTVATADPVAADFGRFLKGLRVARGLSLRQVEQITESKISNAYLSQLENGQIKRPSAVMLNTLSGAYSVDYSVLLEKAGLQAEGADSQRIASWLGEVTPDEQTELMRYLAFIRRR